MKTSVLGFFFIFALAIGNLAAAQRVVNTEDEKIRLQGWEAHQREKERFERERVSDEADLGKDEKAWQKLKDDDLVEYRKDKIQKKKEHDDSGAEYLKDLALKKKEEQNFQEQLDRFLEVRRKVRSNSKSTVKLTEEEELGLNREPDRFDWEKRNLLDPKGTGGGKRSAAPAPRVTIPPSFDSGPPPPPPPGAPTPDFELDVPPPPPPPPPVPEFSEGFGDVPPPPPPDYQDQVPPPPLFEEDF